MSSWTSKGTHLEAKKLVQWFMENSRPLPWRSSRKAYNIWISEIMLQQTTVTAVLPFYKKFIKRFPTVKSLAEAKIEDVYQLWAGLGYYSRARNLHKAAQSLASLKSFPKTYKELIKLPGLGDYTARAVSSQAFGEKVGVVDGNVIRVLCRRFGLRIEHWKNKEKKVLQDIADYYATLEDPSQINQAFMELGATVCTPHSPTCFLCPLKTNCLALKKDLITTLPLKKPKKAMEIWHWEAQVYWKNGQIAFVDNEYAPFLKKQLILPGKIKMKSAPPKKFDFKHGITHHQIYVTLSQGNNKPNQENITWLSPEELQRRIPFSLIKKAMDAVAERNL